jgi:hypothetical protein
MNPFNWGQDYSNANWDIRHRWVTSFTYQLPLLAGANHLGIFIAQTGFPINVTTPQDQANVGLGNQRPNVIATPSANCGNGHLVNCINIAGYQLPSLYTWGSAGRNMLYGPGLRNLDFSMFKSFSLFERAHLEYRAELFNILNTPNFANPSGSLPTLSPNVYAYTTPGNFGNITSTSNNNRSIQMGLKLVF